MTIRTSTPALAALALLTISCGTSLPSNADALVSGDGGDGGAATDGTTPAPDAVVLPDQSFSVDAPAVKDLSTASCNGVGATCTTSCAGGLICQMSGNGAFCAPNRPGCGGFAGAMCMDPQAPICLYLSGADIGVCVSQAESDCICTISPNAVVGC